ncbi:hypothetical protein TYRP_004423 [Tyrophagus putrescentiae]|nr:hypothetical protein TYRP_004423 [Tyrophagus putrescentiae]
MPVGGNGEEDGDDFNAKKNSTDSQLKKLLYTCLQKSTPFAIEDDELINADKNQQAVDAYKKFIIDTAKELYSEEMNTQDNLSERIKEDAEEIIKLETKLAKDVRQHLILVESVQVKTWLMLMDFVKLG